MRQQEIEFKCYNCSMSLLFYQDECTYCGTEIDWTRINQSYADKYLEIFEVYI